MGRRQAVTERRGVEPDAYWGDDRPLTTVLLRGGGTWPIQMRSHIEEERTAGRGSETLFFLDAARTERTYVQSRMYFHAPPDSRREQRLADAQSWFYPAHRSIVLWEVIPASTWWAPTDDPREDLVLRTLWRAYEGFLIARFPDATTLLSTWEDTYHRADWEGFLTTVGYHKSAPATFSKPISRQSADVRRSR
jgi:hypothetical protein